jgi:hypothetical protein
MFNENEVNKKYVGFLFSLLALLVLCNLIIDFKLLDLGYLCIIVVFSLRYLKIHLMSK